MNLTAQKGGGVGCKQQNEHTRLCEHTARELGALGVGVALLGFEGRGPGHRIGSMASIELDWGLNSPSSRGADGRKSAEQRDGLTRRKA